MEIAKHKEQGAGRRERESVHTVWSKKKKKRGGTYHRCIGVHPKTYLSKLRELSLPFFFSIVSLRVTLRFVFPRTIGRKKLKN